MVAVAGLPYPIMVAPGAIERLADVVRAVGDRNRVVVLTDVTVGRLYGHRVDRLLQAFGARVISMEMDEQRKTRETWANLTDVLLEQQFGRDTTIVALGGGVVGDIVGFVAATYMRGVPVVQVPTTLLAMVDASVGGKTGVDTPAGKNLVGAFHQPSAVVIDPLLLETLPPEHIRAGFAEILKHGIVADEEYFERASAFANAWSALRFAELTPLIERSVEIKADIVSRDERESGVRKVLNFGHTIGHAIEAATNYRTLHGEAVAMGLVTEARMAERIGIASGGTSSRIERVCRAVGLPTAMPAIPADTLIGFTRSDKKARGGRVEYALPTRIGQMAGADRGWGIPVDDTTVREALSV